MPATDHVRFYRPAGLDIADALPLRLRRRRWDAGYVVNTIYRKLMVSDSDPRKGVPLMATLLERVVDRNDRKAIIDSLTASGAIERVGGYVPGKRSYHYRLGVRHLSDGFATDEVTCPRMVQKVRADQQRAAEHERAKWMPIHDDLYRELYRLTIDLNHAAEILATIPDASNPYDVQGMLVDAIARREWWLSVGTTGRVFSLLSSLKGELRKALRFRGKPLAEVDIANSQPALLAAVAAVGPHAEAIRAETEHWQRGECYERLIGQLRDAGFPCDRDKVKRLFMRDILAKTGKYQSDIEDVFRRHYPAVYQFIREANRLDHATLIRQLQRAESDLVIRTVAPWLLERRTADGRRPLVVTLHDCIFTGAGDHELVRQAFGEAFVATGHQAVLKVIPNITRPDGMTLAGT